MELLAWSAAYQCGIEPIARQHRYLLDTAAEIRNELGRINDYALRSLTRRLLDYTQYHFAAEEALLAERAPAELNGHKIEHKQKIAYLEGLWADRSQLTPEELFAFVAEWIGRHVVGRDAVLRR